MEEVKKHTIKVIIGLGNPGAKFYYQRHNIGFRILDLLAKQHNAVWHTKDNAEVAEIEYGLQCVLLIKPQTFMNSSGKVVPALLKRGIKAEQILVVHDELELPFGTIKFKIGGSHKGHNGLRSLIEFAGADFVRLRFGIARPERREDVPDYVLQPFAQPDATVDAAIEQAVTMIEQLLQG